MLNGDDPRVFAMRSVDHGPSRGCSPATPTRRRSARCSTDGGRATTVIDGWISVLTPGADPDPLVEVVDVPMTLAGLSRFNVENALAAASAALGVGLPREAVVEGLRSFRPGPEHNPGRMNFFTCDDVTVVIDLAHNEAGLEALLEIMNGVRRPGARLLLGLGAVGDRQRRAASSSWARSAPGAPTWSSIAHKEQLPARPHDRRARRAAPRRRRAGRGRRTSPSYPTEVDGAGGAGRRRPSPATWSALMCHAERAGGLRLDRRARRHARHPGDARGKVRAASAPASAPA